MCQGWFKQVTDTAIRFYIQQLDYRPVQVHLTDEFVLERQADNHTTGATHELSQNEAGQRQLQLNSQALRDRGPNSVHSQVLEALIAQNSIRDSMNTYASLKGPGVVDLAKIKSCRSSRVCSCYRASWLVSPKVLRPVIGRLSITYKYSPFMNGKCDDLQCKRQSSFIAKFTFTFPRWVVQRVVAINAAYTNSSGPELLLRVYRRRSSHDRIFMALYQRDLKARVGVTRKW